MLAYLHEYLHNILAKKFLTHLKIVYLETLKKCADKKAKFSECALSSTATRKLTNDTVKQSNILLTNLQPLFS